MKNLNQKTETKFEIRRSLIVGTLVRSFTVAILSMASIQAAAGPGDGPSADERAKMDAAIQTACGADFTTFCPTAEDHH